MGELSSLRVTVAGAGVFGLVSALTLARRGAQVTLVDPALEGGNASSVAAGMLAPAFEAALDPTSRGKFALLRQARDLWPAFVEDIAPGALHRDGAVYRAGRDAEQSVLERLIAEGAQAGPTAAGVFTPEDWRIEPGVMLSAMRRELERRGVALVHGRAQDVPPGEALVLACGFGARDLAPELSVLTPIKGQLLRFSAGPDAGPCLRGPGGYLVPSRHGAVVGATMQAGREDLTIDAAVTAALLDAAAALSPDLAGVPFEPQVGVRAATPDGLPLVGRSAASGIWLAAGARRNGWLLAPLAAEVLADSLAGLPLSPAADAMRAGRFAS